MAREGEGNVAIAVVAVPPNRLRNVRVYWCEDWSTAYLMRDIVRRSLEAVGLQGWSTRLMEPDEVLEVPQFWWWSRRMEVYAVSGKIGEE